MTRLASCLLSSLGHNRDKAIRSSGLLCNALDTASAAVDACSTSSTAAGAGHFRASTSAPAQTRRYAHRYNLIQPVDTRHINELLESATVLQQAVVPVLQYGNLFDPEQVTRTLQRVPRMLNYQLRKRGQGRSWAVSGDAAVQQAHDTAGILLDALGPRLADVSADCSDEQLARALWAYGASRRCHPEVLDAACGLLPDRLPSMTLPQLATAAWGLAAAAQSSPEGLREPVRKVLQAIASHLVASRPASLTLPPPAAAQLPPSSGGGAAAAASTAARIPLGAVTSHGAAARSLEEGEQPWMDHRSALKLAWAFAAADVRDPEVLDLIGDAAAARIESQVRAHNPASGPLSPRATYLYRTVRGWQAWPRPRPPRLTTAGRRSRFLYDERPRVVLRDFTLSTLAPLLTAFGRLGHRHEGLLQAGAQHVLASAGPSLRIRPADLTRLLGAFHAARFQHPAALQALLGCTQLQTLPAPVLVRLATLAAEWGVRRRTLYERILRQLVARAWVTGEKTDAVAALAAAGEDAAPSAAAAAEQEGGEGAEGVRLEARVVEQARGAAVSWRTAAEGRAAESEGWLDAKYRDEDECMPRDVANMMYALAKVGMQKEQGRPLLVPLFGALLPLLDDRSALPPDSLARLAHVASHFGMVAFSDQASNDILTDLARLALYGERRVTTRGSQARQVRLLAAAASGDAAAAAALREEIGLSARGAALFADALTAAPEERPHALQDNEDMRALLALVDVESCRVELMERVRHVLTSRGRGAALPVRLQRLLQDEGTRGGEEA